MKADTLPNVPKHPSGLPRYAANIPCAGVFDEHQTVACCDAADGFQVRRHPRVMATQMARVLEVIADSTRFSSRFNVSGRISTNTGIPPRSAMAFAVLTKVNDGMITSSPGPTPASSAAISSAAVQECVSRTRAAPLHSCRNCWQ